ncbi:glycoside hydrolase family protein, partial [Klebsiella pneumoniae]|uniref:glycoside hydrolase family protein n=1 Tax=Klebsiella pneumoniae TaxID=573 RepID=UPI0029641D09
FLRTAVNDFMDSVHHIWCPLSSQEFQDLPDGAETTLTMKKLNAGDVNGAADAFLSWNRSGGKVMAGLTNRRKAEREVFLS